MSVTALSHVMVPPSNYHPAKVNAFGLNSTKSLMVPHGKLQPADLNVHEVNLKSCVNSDRNKGPVLPTTSTAMPTN